MVLKKCLYGNGNAIHFSNYGELPCIRAKQINRGIPISVTDNKLHFKLGRMVFGIQINDRFQQDEVDAVLSYLAESEILDDRAVNTLIKDGYCIDTYRPCYATLVPRMIRGKYRVYLHLTIEGKAKPKYDKQEFLCSKDGQFGRSIPGFFRNLHRQLLKPALPYGEQLLFDYHLIRAKNPQCIQIS